MLHIQDEIKEIIEVPHSIRICDYENPYRETEEQHEMGSMSDFVFNPYGRHCKEEKQQIDPSGEELLLALELLEGNQAPGIKVPQVTTIANPTSRISNMEEEK